MEKHHAERISCQYARAIDHPNQAFIRSLSKDVSLELMNTGTEFLGSLRNRGAPFIRITFSVHRKKRIAYIQEIHGLGYPDSLQELFAWLLNVVEVISIQMILNGPGRLTSIDGWFYFDWDDNPTGMLVECEMPLVEEFSRALNLRLSYICHSREDRVDLIQKPPVDTDALRLIFRTIRFSIALSNPKDEFNMIQEHIDRLLRRGELCRGEHDFCLECYYAPYCPYYSESEE